MVQARPAPATQRTSRLAGLDLLRFSAAAGVVLYHYGFRGSVGADRYLDIQFDALSPVCRYGYLGVPLFFMISGFVILMSAAGKSPGEFITSRAARLYPAFWICCLITALATWILGDVRFHVSLQQVLLNLTMFHRHLGVRHIDGVYWSLVVELQFYFLVLALIVTRQIPRAIIFFSIWLVAAEAVMSVEPSVAGGKSLFSLVLLAPWCCYFVAGAAMYLIRTEGANWRNLSLAAASSLAALRGIWFKTADAAAGHVGGPDPLVVTLVITTFFGIFALIVSDRLRVPDSAWTRALGTLTYPLYLLHQNLGYMLLNTFDDWLNRYALLAAVVLLMLAAAGLVHRFVERPLSPVLKRGLARALARQTVSTK